MIVSVIKFICLVIAIWSTSLNHGLALTKQDVPACNYLMQSLSTAIFLFIQFNMFV